MRGPDRAPGPLRAGRPVRGAAAALLALTALAACTAGDGASEEPSSSASDGTAQDAPATADLGTAGAPAAIMADRVQQLTSPHEATGGTLLEGPVFAEDSSLYLVDVMAPPGEPKVLRVDPESGESEAVYTDDSSAFTSAQFHPGDGRLYLTDIASGSVVSMTAEGEGLRTEFTGEVDGTPMMPDDITIAADGTLYVSDTTGMQSPGWETPGRVVRIAADGTATALAENLPSPNGIVLDENESGLYLAQYNANRVDYMALDEAGEAVTAAYPALHLDAGRARVDSTAVDAEGNIYQAFHGRPEIEVHSPSGEHLATIAVPAEERDGLDSATNIAIRPGTTEGVMTVSGSEGGMVYRFEAPGEGGAHSNGS
ncbi:SMP-30/gluconolactonase/LRE family protein [Brachybacterium sp. YJGR34]|uniref:SMP-30/gluconolactonase/LRE family protein n=1 Tax=Brachybacterium sp. YJGR34 TaxID=2059911 RepID=UPI000E0B93E2|nr:SMP-30/gluconolactonase/LRE family protein [Brachybacterium sp. YJGR34]